MADDRTRAHAAAGPDEEIHDDDELAEALAAELERIAPTGAVPVLRASAVPFGPVRAAGRAAEHPPQDAAAVDQGSTEPPRSDVRPPAAEPGPGTALPPPDPATPASAADAVRPDGLAARSARRHVVAPVPGSVAGEQHHRHADVSARHAGRAVREGRMRAVAPVADSDDQDGAASGEASLAPSPPVRAARIPSFSTTAEPRAAAPAGRRRATDPEAPSTQPARIPGAARPVPDAVPPESLDLQDPLRETGPLALPPTLYETWERSLRSIGRPGVDGWDDTATADHSDPAAETVSLPRAALGPLPEPPAPAVPGDAPPADGAPAPEVRRRRRARRAAAEPTDPGPEVVPVPVPDPIEAIGAAPSHAAVAVSDAPPASSEEESDGVDEVDTGIRAVSAAETAAIPLPPMIEQVAPVTGAVPVRAQPAAASGERRAPLGGPSLLALLLLLVGALSSPALLLAGFGLAAVGAGGAAAGGIVLGVAVALPAAVRLVTAADADRVGSPGIAARLLGPRAGPAAAWVLLAARLLAAAIALLGVADLAGAFTARTGVGGTSSSAASITAVVVAGLVALVAVAWPRRTTRTVLGVLSGVALVVLLAVLVATGPALATPVPTVPPAGSAVLAGAVGFAVPGLLLTATIADAALLSAGRRRGGGAAAATVLAAVAGLVVLVLALAVGRGAGASGDAATALAGVVADATTASAAGPLAIALLVAALPLPALLLATSGDAAAVLIGAGRSARLGSVAAGLLVLAVVLALFAAGLTAPVAFATLGPVLGVPVAVWTGLATASPLRSGAARAVQLTRLVTAAVATAIGWLLVDGLVVAGERSPVLDLLRVPLGSAWRGSPTLGLLAALLLGVLAAVLGRIATARAAAPPASRLRSTGGMPVDSVEA